MGPPSSIPCFRLIFSRARFPMRWSHRARLREIIKEMAGRSFWPAFFDCPLPGSSFCTLSNVWAVMRLAGVVLPPPPDSAHPPGPELLVLESKGRHLHLSGLRLPFVRPSVRLVLYRSGSCFVAVPPPPPVRRSPPRTVPTSPAAAALDLFLLLSSPHRIDEAGAGGPPARSSPSADWAAGKEVKEEVPATGVLARSTSSPPPAVGTGAWPSCSSPSSCSSALPGSCPPPHESHDSSVADPLPGEPNDAAADGRGLADERGELEGVEMGDAESETSWSWVGCLMSERA
jgi:hypothetical protein